MNLGTNYTHRVTLRLNDEQYDFIIKISAMLGVSPSDYLRMAINTGMVTMPKNIDETTEELSNKMKGLVGTNENVKADSNNIV